MGERRGGHMVVVEVLIIIIIIIIMWHPWVRGEVATWLWWR